MSEECPGNRAGIGDLVGDDVGECAGRGADIFESTAAENIGAMILGASVALALGATQPSRGWVIFPLVVVGLGIIASMVGLLMVQKSRVKEPAQASGKDPGEIALAQR